MGQLYNISVVNTEPGCDSNFIQKTVSITGCSETIVLRLSASSNATGPFDVYTGSTSTTTPPLSGLTKSQMVSGVSLLLAGDDPSACITPSQTPTPTVTVTPTPTPSATPPPSAAVYSAYLFIEPLSLNLVIGQYMTNQGVGFPGFSNQWGPDTSDATQFNLDMNAYVSFPGWGQTYPSVRTQTVPQNSGGVDAYGQPIVAYNFTTHRVPAGLITEPAWYTWIIPVAGTNGGIQTKIDFNANSNVGNMTTVNMESTIYSQTFTYTGSVIPAGTYRVYTTFAGPDFLINGTSESIYFRGNTVV